MSLRGDVTGPRDDAVRAHVKLAMEGWLLGFDAETKHKQSEYPVQWVRVRHTKYLESWGRNREVLATSCLPVALIRCKELRLPTFDGLDTVVSVAWCAQLKAAVYTPGTSANKSYWWKAADRILNHVVSATRIILGRRQRSQIRVTRTIYYSLDLVDSWVLFFSKKYLCWGVIDNLEAVLNFLSIPLLCIIYKCLIRAAVAHISGSILHRVGPIVHDTKQWNDEWVCACGKTHNCVAYSLQEMGQNIWLVIYGGTTMVQNKLDYTSKTPGRTCFSAVQHK